MVQNGPKCVKMYQNVSKWSKMVKKGKKNVKKCGKMVQNVSKWCKIVQNGHKMVQNGLECANVSKLSGPTENRTRITSLQDKCASHYTIGPLK